MLVLNNLSKSICKTKGQRNRYNLHYLITAVKFESRKVDYN